MPKRPTQQAQLGEPGTMVPGDNYYMDNTPPDSGIAMDNEEVFRLAMEAATNRVGSVATTVDHNGVSVSYTPEQLTMMGSELAKARAEGRFPPTKAASYDIQATAHDYLCLLSLNEARGTAPREEWHTMPYVVELLVRIKREIQARDKVTAEKTEEQRVNAHVTNMMSGVGAEAKLYSIVQHAVTYAVKNGSDDQAATTAGQNMVAVLDGIRGVIRDMGGRGTHGINDHNVESVLEEVFRMIDYALGSFVDPLDENVKKMDGQYNRVDGQINRVDGQIMHLHAIGQHVDAIDNHVHSLGNNLNAMGTLLNSTNGNITVMTSQVSLLQTIVNMLPRMIADSLKQQLPATLQIAMSPIVDAFEAQLGASFYTGTTANEEGNINGKRKFFKSISSRFRNLFKKSGGGSSFV
ncbi:hypothetical protein F4677DRAFT_440687 [Hypoxylon crocopeplum]|nr:hypothetical protein F4677DRAFT_440687 [Hypoxylon crocopeplum]